MRRLLSLLLIFVAFTAVWAVQPLIPNVPLRGPNDIIPTPQQAFNEQMMTQNMMESIKASADAEEIEKSRFRFGILIMQGFSEGKAPPPRQARVVNDLFETLSQPAEALVLLRGLRPAAYNGRVQGSIRTYMLNTALKQILPGSTQEVDAPNFVDFLDGADFEARIDIDRGATAYYEPSDMALSQDGRRLVVTARGSNRTFFPNNPVPPHLDVIDTATAAYVKRIPFPETLWPTNVVLSTDGSLAYIGMTTLNGNQITGQQAIHIVNIDSGATIGTIPLPDGGRTGEMAMTPDGALLFILAGTHLYEIDVRSRTVTADITGAPTLTPTVHALRESTNLAMNPQGTKLYLIDAAAPLATNDFTTVGVGVVDIATATLVDLISIPGTTRRGSGDDIRTGLGGRVILAMDGVSGLLTFIDANSREIIRQIDRGDAISRTALSEGP